MYKYDEEYCDQVRNVEEPVMYPFPGTFATGKAFLTMLLQWESVWFKIGAE